MAVSHRRRHPLVTLVVAAAAAAGGGAWEPLPPRNASSAPSPDLLGSVAITVLMGDQGSANATVSAARFLASAYLNEAPHRLLAAASSLAADFAEDSSAEGGISGEPMLRVERCWDGACARLSPSSTCRLEAAFACAHAKFRGGSSRFSGGGSSSISGGGGPARGGPRWFLFTAPGVFWHAEGLAAELARVEKLLQPAVGNTRPGYPRSAHAHAPLRRVFRRQFS